MLRLAKLAGLVVVLLVPLAFRGAGGTGVARPAAATPAPAPTPSAAVRWSLVSLGDSVPAGAACRCHSYVYWYARAVHATARNQSVSGQTSAGLLRMLSSSSRISAAVAAADIVTITIGANDFDYARSLRVTCGRLECYRGGLASLRKNMTAILSLIRELRQGRPTAIRVTGYWEIWEDGQVGRSHGSRYMAIGDALTRQVNAVLRAVSTRMGVGYVDLYGPFRGRAGEVDDTDLLAADGDHPSAAGQRLIAAVLFRTGLAPLTG